MFAFASSVGLVYVTNITTISKSMCTTSENMVQNTSLFTNDSTGNITVKNATTTCLNTYDDRLTIIIPITNAIVSLSVGLFSDYFKARLPRLWIVMFACACFLVSQVLVLCFAYKIFFLMLATVFAGTAIGVLWSLAPTIMNEMFYVGNLGRNWGIAILVAALLGFGIQELFGVLYDAQINTTEAHVCHGMSCITGGVATCLASASVSIVLGVVMQLKKSWSRRCANLV